MRGGALYAGTLALAACASSVVPGQPRKWSPEELGGIPSAYIHVPENSGEWAGILVNPTQEVRGAWSAGAIGLRCADALGRPSWVLEGTDFNESLGWSVVAMQDIDGDGWGEVSVGGPGAAAEGLYERGCVLLVSGRTGGVIWRADGKKGFDHLGECVAPIADWNGDGVQDVLALAACEGRDRDLSGGCVIVFSGKTGERLWQTDVEGGGEAPERSGCSCDDIDGDGREDIVVGLPGWNGSVGCARVYGSRTGSLVWQADGVSKDGLFGAALRRTLDFDGDGRRDLLLLAPGEGEHGELVLLSGANGTRIRTIRGDVGDNLFGVMMEVPDCNGDGLQETGIVTYGDEGSRVRLYSGSTLDVIGHFPQSRLDGGEIRRK